MSFSVEIRGIEELINDSENPIAGLVMDAYGRRPIRGSRITQSSFKFSYQALPPKSIKRVIGDLAESEDSIGLFVDEVPEPDPDDQFAADFFSATKLALEIAERFPQIATLSLGQVYHGYETGQFSDEQLFAAVLIDFVRDPLAGYPVIVFRW